jgi:putative RecB family exonuclease
MYSNSRIQTFEQCPHKYKLRYVDNIKTDGEGIEAFVGKRVHEAMEKLYRDLKLAKLNSLEDLLAFYESAWEKNWHGKVTVVREGFTPANYFENGRRCITDYYKRHTPFNQGKTLGLEERIEMKLQDGDKQYSIQGYIDRLTWVPEEETYEIHDYKTSNSLPTQEDVDQDRQLALYHFGIAQRWPDAKKVKLVWHYLAFDKQLTSSRSLSELQSMEREVVEVIHKIEKEATLGRWEVKISRLCEWCEYKPICPAWKHPVAMESVAPNLYLQDSGVQLVEKYSALEEGKADLQAKIKAIETEQKKIEAAVLAYGEKESISVIDGPGYRLQIKTDDEWKIPRKGEDPLSWELLRNTLKNAGKLEDVSTVNARMLQYASKRGKWPEALIKSVLSFVTVTARKTVQLVKK